MAKNWLDSIEKQKRRSNLKGCYTQTDTKQRESLVDHNRLLAKRGDQYKTSI